MSGVASAKHFAVFVKGRLCTPSARDSHRFCLADLWGNISGETVDCRACMHNKYRACLLMICLSDQGVSSVISLARTSRTHASGPAVSPKYVKSEQRLQKMAQECMESAQSGEIRRWVLHSLLADNYDT